MSRALLTLLAGCALLAAWWFGAWELLSWDNLASRREDLRRAADTQPAAAAALFLIAYVVVAAASLPIATPLTLLGGALFGFGPGLVLVSLGSTTGATLAAAISRWLIAERVRRSLAGPIARMDAGLERDGAAWLLAVRLVPALPFFVVNLTLGLSKVPLRTIFWTSQLGMLPLTAVYVWTGAELGLVQEVGDLVSPRLWLALLTLAAAPFLVRRLVERWRGPEQPPAS